MCLGLEELLAHLFWVRADHDKEAVGEADEHVAVSEPVVVHNVAIATLEGKLTRKVGFLPTAKLTVLSLERSGLRKDVAVLDFISAQTANSGSYLE